MNWSGWWASPQGNWCWEQAPVTHTILFVFSENKNDQKGGASWETIGWTRCAFSTQWKQSGMIKPKWSMILWEWLVRRSSLDVRRGVQQWGSTISGGQQWRGRGYEFNHSTDHRPTVEPRCKSPKKNTYNTQGWSKFGWLGTFYCCGTVLSC